MGNGTVVNAVRPAKPVAAQKSLRLRIDVPLLLVVVTLIVFGLLMLYSASWDFSLMINESANYIFMRQLMWLGVGLLAAVFLDVQAAGGDER